MTVKELIEKLKEYDMEQDHIVAIKAVTSHLPSVSITATDDMQVESRGDYILITAFSEW